MSHPRTFLSALTCATLVIAGLAVPAPVGAGRYKTSSVEVSRGVTLLKVYDSRGPNRIRVLKIDPTKAATVDVALPRGTFPGFTTPLSMARDYHAIAAVNADFTAYGHPLHPFIEDFKIQTEGPQIGHGFSVTKDEDQAFIGRGAVISSAYNVRKDSTYEIARWNFQDPRGDQIAAYTQIGGSIESPPDRACQARLFPVRQSEWSDADRNGVVRAYKVVKKDCGGKALGVGDYKSAVVLSSHDGKGPAARWVQGLGIGTRVRLRWSIPAFPGVPDRMGGAPMLLEDGKIVAPSACGSFFCLRNPRTGVGTTPDGEVLYITVDGRQKESIGMTLPDFARVFIRYGANWAMNLDGGGSTVMTVKLDGEYKTVNRPAVSHHRKQRPVTSALIVLPKADPGEPGGLDTMRSGETTSGLAPASSGGDVSGGEISKAAARRAWAAAIRDPGSTGGLLDAMASGGLGPQDTLTPELRDVLQRYRSYWAGRSAPTP